MLYLLDSVTVIRHFSSLGKLGKEAKKVLANIENNIDSAAISVVSLMEIMYLSEKKRINISLNETIKIIDGASNYTIVDLTKEIVQTANHIDFHELHDRLILATAKYLDISILSSEQRFKQVKDAVIVWD